MNTLLERLKNYTLTMAPHIRERQQGKLIIEATNQLDQLQRLAASIRAECTDEDGKPVRNCACYLDRGMICPECPVQHAEEIEDVLNQ